MVVVLEIVVQVRDQLAGEATVLVAWVQLFPLVERRIERDTPLLSDVQRFNVHVEQVGKAYSGDRRFQIVIDSRVIH